MERKTWRYHCCLVCMQQRQRTSQVRREETPPKMLTPLVAILLALARESSLLADSLLTQLLAWGPSRYHAALASLLCQLPDEPSAKRLQRLHAFVFTELSVWFFFFFWNDPFLFFFSRSYSLHLPRTTLVSLHSSVPFLKLFDFARISREP